MLLLWLIAVLALAGCVLGIYSTVMVHTKSAAVEVNPTNLKVDNGRLNTIQDIAPTSAVQFGTVDLSNLKVSGDAFITTTQLLGGRTFHNAVVESAVEGSNELFKVPSGKKAMVTQIMIFNSSDGEVIWYPEYDFGLGFTSFDETYPVQSQAWDGISIGFSSLILSANERFSIRSDSPAIRISASYVLFPDSFPTTLYRATASSTKSTLFTCPEGKVAYSISPTVGTYTTSTSIRACNQTGNTMTVTVSLQTAGGTEKTIAALDVLANGRTSFNLGVLTAGDVVRVVSDTDDLVYVYLAVALFDELI